MTHEHEMNLIEGFYLQELDDGCIALAGMYDDYVYTMFESYERAEKICNHLNLLSTDMKQTRRIRVKPSDLSDDTVVDMPLPYEESSTKLMWRCC